MKKRTVAVTVIIVFAGLLSFLCVREWRDVELRKQAAEIVEKFDGRIGSLPSPIPFWGSELVVSLSESDFRSEDLDRLVIFEELARRHIIFISLPASMSEADFGTIERRLPSCNLRQDSID